MAVRCTLKVEWIRCVGREDLGARIATFPEERFGEIGRALLSGLGLDH
jgi:mRNA-degrading endonuclease toxin of MazEF toxin-antitoxin module